MRDPRTRLNPDVAAGLIFVLCGGWFFAASVLGLKLGSAFRMGPGFFPAVIGGLLLCLGLVIAADGARRPSAETWGPVPWRAVMLIPAGLVLFGLVMRPLGLLPALLLLCLCAALGSGRMSPARMALVTLGMTALCIGIFSFGLGIGLPLLGDWLR
jgi:hypothetical protein